MTGPAPAQQAAALPADSLRAVLDSVFSAGQYQWAQRHDPLAFLREWWAALARWLETLGHNHPGVYLALLWAAVAVLAAIMAHAGWVLVRVMRGAVAPPAVTGRAGPRGPDELERARAEARRLAAAGRFAEAIRADFRRLVLELDARSVVRFHPGKTPFEYVREPGLAPADRGWLADVVRMLYGVAYAGQPCGAEEFAGWHRLAERHAAPH